MMDRFDTPDITILTNDGEATMALWRMANADRDSGNSSYEMAEKMQKAFTPERIHEIWIVVNDGLKSGVLLAGIYAALKPFTKAGKKIAIRFRASFKISRDDQDRLESLGCAIEFEKPEEPKEIE
jgi:hypothetical protein